MLHAWPRGLGFLRMKYLRQVYSQTAAESFIAWIIITLKLAHILVVFRNGNVPLKIPAIEPRGVIRYNLSCYQYIT